MVFSYDSSLSVWGITSSYWDRSEAGKVGRVSERSRFKRAAGHSARESALSDYGAVREELREGWKEGRVSAEDLLAAEGWAIEPGFPEVPKHLLEKTRWTPKQWGRWEKAEHATLLDARAAAKTCQRAAFSYYGQNSRPLMLEDNMSTTLCFDRCRAKDFEIPGLP